MSAITRIPDYVERGLARLPVAYRGLPRITALLTTYLAQCQAVEDAFWAVFIDRLLQFDFGTGDILDKLGTIVGQDRLGYGDDAYRLMLRARIRANKSGGRIEDLIAVGIALRPLSETPPAHIAVTEHFPAAVEVVIEGPAIVNPALVASGFLGPAVSAGVGLMLGYTMSPITATFIFASTVGATRATEDASFGDSVAGDIGGVLGGMISIDGGGV